jgi:hypothetical protein
MWHSLQRTLAAVYRERDCSGAGLGVSELQVQPPHCRSRHCHWQCTGTGSGTVQQKKGRTPKKAMALSPIVCGKGRKGGAVPVVHWQCPVPASGTGTLPQAASATASGCIHGTSDSLVPLPQSGTGTASGTAALALALRHWHCQWHGLLLSLGDGLLLLPTSIGVHEE